MTSVQEAAANRWRWGRNAAATGCVIAILLFALTAATGFPFGLTQVVLWPASLVLSALDASTGVALGYVLVGIAVAANGLMYGVLGFAAAGRLSERRPKCGPGSDRG